MSVLDALRWDHDRTTDQIESLERSVARIIEASELTATDDEHDPEGSTIAFERSQTTTFLEDARKHLADLDSALERLDAGDYGSCDVCGKPIATGRLLARPTARTCIDCAT